MDMRDLFILGLDESTVGAAVYQKEVVAGEHQLRMLTRRVLARTNEVASLLRTQQESRVAAVFVDKKRRIFSGLTAQFEQQFWSCMRFHVALPIVSFSIE